MLLEARIPMQRGFYLVFGHDEEVSKTSLSLFATNVLSIILYFFRFPWRAVIFLNFTLDHGFTRSSKGSTASGERKC